MRKYIIAFLVIVLFSFQVPLRINGKYKVVHDKVANRVEDEVDYIIEFREENYTKQYQEDETEKGRILRISNRKSKNLIRLRDLTYSHPKAGIYNQKLKTNQVLEFEESDLDTIPFRTIDIKQLDKIVNTGKLIKIK